jgi:DNA repair protein RecO (recombination protein O)
MSSEKALALVLRTTDWSETSRIATLWTRELGKVRALAKGGRRLRSNFESGLDLLTLCSIVLLRKSSGALDLLTEARVVRRFPRLRSDLGALYAAYYVAELLADWTEEHDPHPALFDEAVSALEDLGTGDGPGPALGARVARFELVLLRELGHLPVLDRCANCGGTVEGRPVLFSPEAGGALCPRCCARPREARPLSAAGVAALRALAGEEGAWRRPWDEGVRAELRQALGLFVTYVRGRRPRLLPYLGS